MLPLPISALRVASVALKNPGNIDAAVSLTREQFRYGFGNGISEDESDELFDKWAIPSPGRPLFQAATANFNPHAQTKVDTKNEDRGPLLLTMGGKDHTVPRPSASPHTSSTGIRRPRPNSPSSPTAATR